MAASLRLKSSLQRLKPLLQLQRLNHTFVEGEVEARLFADLGPKTMVTSGHVDTSKWKKMDSRSLGITPSMIPDSSRIILQILQNEGHDAYLVGGCVRDLLLNRVPKDFDVITTANLQEIRRQFHRAFIIGKRFPICKVLLKGSAVEVSSFETVARDAKEKEAVHVSEIPKGYGEKDFMRWKNALQRDFTINSLFYDPFAHKIYDYSSGMADLTSMKLRTLVPAHLSFKEDCARILRGLRIAARLRLSFAKDTEKAMNKLYASVTNLDKARLMMEMNYMLSYGAAEPSLLLLKRFNLLQIILPFHAAYLNDHSGAQTPRMLMKLFFNLDSMVSCDQPCDFGLWISLLAFHLALVNNPQDALVVWTFASVLYHGNWNEGVRAARQLAESRVNFPEILKPCTDVSNDELAHMVANFASIVLDSVYALTDSKSLVKAMTRYPSSPCSGLVFISKNAGNEVVELLNVLVNDITLFNNERNSCSIDYKLLGKGNIRETRFVFGKVIMNTMRSGITLIQTKFVEEGKQAVPGELEKSHSTTFELETPKSKDRVKRGLDVADNQLQQRPKKQKNKMLSSLEEKLVKEKMSEILSCKDIGKKKQLLKTVVVKDVKRLLSEVSQRSGKLEMRKHGVVQTSNKMLEDASKMAEEFVAQDPEDVPIMQKKARKVKQAKAKGPTEMLKLLQLPKLFKGEKELTVKEDTPEKKQEEGEEPKQRIRKLSSIFK